MKDTDTLFKVAAGIGAVLGIINIIFMLVRTYLHDRVRLQVIPEVRTLTAYAERITKAVQVHSIFVTVINHSAFPVTVVALGFRHGRWGRGFAMPTFIIGKKDYVPYRLDPRDSFTAMIWGGLVEEPWFKNIRKAYVKTACGHTISGSSRALKHFVTHTSSYAPMQKDHAIGG
jgi:hypothetical protein